MTAPLAPISVRFARAGAYEVHFEPLDRVTAMASGAGLEARGALIVTDTNVGPLYAPVVADALARAGWRVNAHAIPAGETSKDAAALAGVYKAAMAAGLERTDAVFALGGGVVGDLAGYAAATWLRGLPLVHLPTSLVAQCDSAIGGKTGINHAGIKNLVGAIWPPRLVLVDVATLETLPDGEFESGLSEVVKAAFLEGESAIADLEAAWSGILSRDPTVVGPVVRRAVGVKARVVSNDELESGERAFLNLGHTFAHAIESAGHLAGHTHGQAVALGLRAALHLSASLAARRPLPPAGDLPAPFDCADALAARLPVGPPLEASVPALERALAADKKRQRGVLRFVVLDAPGRPRLAPAVPAPMITAAWGRARACSRPERRDGR